MCVPFQISEKAILLEDEPLAPVTSFNIGGPARYLLMPAEIEDITRAMDFSREKGLPFLVLGSGTNILVPDEGIPGVVVKFWKNFNNCRIDGNFITAQAGLDMLGMAQFAAEAGLTGIEWGCGLPGTVGGAVCMNAGVKDLEIKNIFRNGTILTGEGAIETWEKEKFAFAYRSSAIQGSGSVVLQAKFELKPGEREEIFVSMNQHLDKRKMSQPINLPNCGSVFRNPQGTFAAKLIQESGLKGYNVGGVMVSPQHANFIVNTGGGKAADVVELIRVIKERVMAKFQVELELELKILD